MYEVDKTEMKKIAPLFEGIQDSMVIACLQGYMGKAYTRSSDSMEAALWYGNTFPYRSYRFCALNSLGLR